MSLKPRMAVRLRELFGDAHVCRRKHCSLRSTLEHEVGLLKQYLIQHRQRRSWPCTQNQMPAALYWNSMRCVPVNQTVLQTTQATRSEEVFSTSDLVRLWNASGSVVHLYSRPLQPYDRPQTDHTYIDTGFPDTYNGSKISQAFNPKNRNGTLENGTKPMLQKNHTHPAANAIKTGKAGCQCLPPCCW